MQKLYNMEASLIKYKHTRHLLNQITNNIVQIWNEVISQALFRSVMWLQSALLCFIRTMSLLKKVWWFNSELHSTVARQTSAGWYYWCSVMPSGQYKYRTSPFFFLKPPLQLSPRPFWTVPDSIPSPILGPYSSVGDPIHSCHIVPDFPHTAHRRQYFKLHF